LAAVSSGDRRKWSIAMQHQVKSAVLRFLPPLVGDALKYVASVMCGTFDCSRPRKTKGREARRLALQ
jgi:hypothetical protein